MERERESVSSVAEPKEEEEEERRTISTLSHRCSINSSLRSSCTPRTHLHGRVGQGDEPLEGHDLGDYSRDLITHDEQGVGDLLVAGVVDAGDVQSRGEGGGSSGKSRVGEEGLEGRGDALGVGGGRREDSLHLGLAALKEEFLRGGCGRGVSFGVWAAETLRVWRGGEREGAAGGGWEVYETWEEDV